MPNRGRSFPHCLRCSSWPSVASSNSRNLNLLRPSSLLVTPLAKLLEAALFASVRPIPVEELVGLDADASPAGVAAALDELREHYDTDGHGVELMQMGDG